MSSNIKKGDEIWVREFMGFSWKKAIVEKTDEWHIHFIISETGEKNFVWFAQDQLYSIKKPILS